LPHERHCKDLRKINAIIVFIVYYLYYIYSIWKIKKNQFKMNATSIANLRYSYGSKPETAIPVSIL
jgi:hypothetical protein